MSFGRTIKIGLCWIAVLAGLSIGIFCFALLGVVPLVGPYPVPWQTWLESITLFSFGCTAFTASFVDSVIQGQLHFSISSERHSRRWLFGLPDSR
jgi:hypothetical protein